MNPLARLSLGAKLLIGFGLTIALLGAIVTTAYVGLIQVQRSQQQLLEEHFGNIYDLASFRSSVNAERLALAVMMEVGAGERSQWQAELQRRREMEQAILDRLLDRFQDDPPKLQRLQQLIGIQTAFIQAREKELLPAITQGRIKEARRLFVGIQLQRHQAIRNIVDDLEQDEVQLAQDRVAETARDARTYRISFLLLGLIALLIGWTIAVVSRRMVVTYLRERNRAAREAVEQFKLAESFFNHSVSGLVVLDRDYNFLRVNEAYARASGRKVGDYVGRNHFEMYPSDARAIFDGVVRSKRPFQTFARPFEFPDQPERGVTYWDWTLVPVLDDGGEVQYLVFSLNDVTERQRAEEALRHSQADLIEAQRVAHLGSWEWDTKKDRLTWSDETYRIFGQEPGRPPSFYAESYTEDSQVRLAQAVEHALREGVEFELDLELSLEGGARTRWITARGEARRDAAGEIRGLRGTVQDITARKAAEDAVKASEERFRLIAETIEDVFYMSTPGADEMIYISPAYERLWGRSRESLYRSPRSFIDGLHPDDRPAMLEMMERHRRGEPYEIEYRVAQKSGAVRWMHERAFPIRDQRGIVRMMTGIVSDTTERKRAEEAMRRSERELRARLAEIEQIYRYAPVGLFMMDRDYRFLRVNERLAEMNGSTVEEYLGHTLWEVVPNLADRLAELYRIVFEQGEPVLGVEVHGTTTRTPDVDRDWLVNFLPVKSETGEVTALIGAVLEITERKRVEEALRAREEQLNSLFLASPAGLALLDSQFRYLRINAPLAEANGLSIEAHIGKTIYEVLPRVAPKVAPLFRRVLNGETVYNVEVSGETPQKPGFIRHWVASYFPIRDASGRITMLGGVVLEVTERKALEEELRKHRHHLEDLVRQRTAELEQANARLQELDRLKSMFIASMSHELRTPLNTIIGFTGIILQGMTGPINAEQNKQLGMVKQSAMHLLSLINDVIDVSKIEAGAVELSVTDFDLMALAREVADSFAVALENKGLAIGVQGPQQLLVDGDRRRVKQILVNLVGNAVKFTDSGRIDLLVGSGDGGTTVAVKDTGIGIGDADIGKLFSAFTQIVTEGRPKEGSGLGLYLSQRIAHLMGGEIRVQSKLGAGSVFTLFLPAAAQEVAA